LRERTAILVMHAGQLRSPARRDLAGSLMSEPAAMSEAAPTRRRYP
jgi:hypothetical protein